MSLVLKSGIRKVHRGNFLLPNGGGNGTPVLRISDNYFYEYLATAEVGWVPNAEKCVLSFCARGTDQTHTDYDQADKLVMWLSQNGNLGIYIYIQRPPTSGGGDLLAAAAVQWQIAEYW